jgi:hypothetical protein
MKYRKTINPETGKEVLEPLSDMDQIKIFGDRLKRIGIDVKFAANYPWIYIISINGKNVTEIFEAEHGFTIAFMPIRNDRDLKFTDIGEIFNLIRKYRDETET